MLLITANTKAVWAPVGVGGPGRVGLRVVPCCVHPPPPHTHARPRLLAVPGPAADPAPFPIHCTCRCPSGDVLRRPAGLKHARKENGILCARMHVWGAGSCPCRGRGGCAQERGGRAFAHFVRLRHRRLACDAQDCTGRGCNGGGRQTGHVWGSAADDPDPLQVVRKKAAPGPPGPSWADRIAAVRGTREAELQRSGAGRITFAPRSPPHPAPHLDDELACVARGVEARAKEDGGFHADAAPKGSQVSQCAKD